MIDPVTDKRPSATALTQHPVLCPLAAKSKVCSMHCQNNYPHCCFNVTTPQFRTCCGARSLCTGWWISIHLVSFCYSESISC